MKKILIALLLMGALCADYQMPISTFLAANASTIASWIVPTFGNLYYDVGNVPMIVATYRMQSIQENNRTFSEPTTVTAYNKTLTFFIDYPSALSCYHENGAAACYFIFINASTYTSYGGKSIMPLRMQLTNRVNAERLAISRLQAKINAYSNAVVGIPMSDLRTMISRER